MSLSTPAYQTVKSELTLFVMKVDTIVAPENLHVPSSDRDVFSQAASSAVDVWPPPVNADPTSGRHVSQLLA